jgi:large subunit ribosomal protein L10
MALSVHVLLEQNFLFGSEIAVNDNIMLTKAQKEEKVKEIKEKLEQNKVLVIADFSGLSVKDLRELKKEIRGVGGSIGVYKKTLMDIALRKANVDFDIKSCTGPLIFAFGPEETSVPKKVWNFVKKNENLRVESGLLENRAISAAEIESLAKMPSKEELLTRLTGSINAPLSGLVYVLSGTIGSLINVLGAAAKENIKGE